MKQNALLAKTEHSSSQYNANILEYVNTFKDKAKAHIFTGLRQTYQANEGYLDEPSKKGFKPVQNTVPEYLKYFLEICGQHVSNVFTIEATNSSGMAKAKLMIEGEEWGEFSTLELLRLRTFLDSKELIAMYQTLPVRRDDIKWKKSSDAEAKGDLIWETEVYDSPNRTTLKEAYILEDPNIGQLKDAAGYKPQIASKDTQVVMGNQTVQYFSGEISHRERAAILSRLSKLKEAGREALAKANEVQVVPSGLTAEKIFGYIHGM